MANLEPTSWEFEGPVDFIKQLARSRDIPKEKDDTKRNSSFDSNSTDGQSSLSSAEPSRPASVSHNVSNKTLNVSGAFQPQNAKADIAFGGSPPKQKSAPLPPGMPPPLPGGMPPPLRSAMAPPRMMTQPPLPPGPPPPRGDFRKAAPLPDFVKAALPPPTSVSAFKTPPLPHGAPRPNVPMEVPSLLTSNDKPKQVKRPRGMSLSSSSVRRTVDSYDKLFQVGRGTYAEVFKARDKETGDIVALKKVRLEDEQEGFPVTALREIKFLQQVKHRNIVHLREVVTSKATDATRNKGSVYMVFEYAVCDLVGLMDKSSLTESHIMCIVKQLLDALHFAHVNKVLHRDIKPANILVTSEGLLKLADWGLCRRWAEGNRYTNRVVTRWYRAPELLLGEQQYTGAIDMWAVGCVMAELFIGRALLPGKDEVDQLKIIFDLCGKPTKESMPIGWLSLPLAKELLTGEPTQSQMNMRFAFLKPPARDLILRMLELDPTKRITAKDALQHDWFWGTNPAICEPRMLPVPKGDGMHEHQLREEAARKEKQRQEAAGQRLPPASKH